MVEGEVIEEGQEAGAVGGVAHGDVDFLACVGREVHVEVVPLVLTQISHLGGVHHGLEVSGLGIAGLANQHLYAVQVVVTNKHRTGSREVACIEIEGSTIGRRYLLADKPVVGGCLIVGRCCCQCTDTAVSFQVVVEVLCLCEGDASAVVLNNGLVVAQLVCHLAVHVDGGEVFLPVIVQRIQLKTVVEHVAGQSLTAHGEGHLAAALELNGHHVLDSLG